MRKEREGKIERRDREEMILRGRQGREQSGRGEEGELGDRERGSGM